MGKIVSVTAPNKVEFHSWNLLFQNNFNAYKPEEWLCESGNLLTTSLNNYFINSMIPQNNNTPKICSQREDERSELKNNGITQSHYQSNYKSENHNILGFL